MGNCLAGDGCPFSHDPSALVSNLSVDDNPQQISAPAFSQAYMDSTSESFPPLQTTPGMGDQWAGQYLKYPAHLGGIVGSKAIPQGMQLGVGRRNGSMTHNARPHSRPSSRHQHRELNPAAPSVDDPDAFPTLAAVSKGAGKKHHGKRGSHNNRDSSSSKENVPASLADVVRMTPSPAAGKGRSTFRNSKDGAKSRENSAAALAIPPPQNIPWLETGMRANQQYLKCRSEAIRHGTVRNKFLQR